MSKVSEIVAELRDWSNFQYGGNQDFQRGIDKMRNIMIERLEAVSSIHEAEPVNSSLVKSYIDMWQGESDDFDAKYGKHIIGTEYELGNCETRREEMTECRIGVLREVLPVLRAAHPAPISKGVMVKALIGDSGPHDNGPSDGENGELDAGINYAIERLCEILDVDPRSISWDAATETMDGDVSSVICNVLRAAYGEEWSSKPETTARILSCLSHTAGEIEAGGEDANTPFNVFVTNALHEQETGALKRRIAELTEQAGKCASLLEVLAEEFENRGDTASWSMASVMATDTRTALSTHSGDKL